MMSTFKTLIAEARSLVLEGKLDEAEARRTRRRR
jgi:hypothetical protein